MLQAVVNFSSDLSQRSRAAGPVPSIRRFMRANPGANEGANEGAVAEASGAACCIYDLTHTIIVSSALYMHVHVQQYCSG